MRRSKRSNTSPKTAAIYPWLGKVAQFDRWNTGHERQMKTPPGEDVIFLKIKTFVKNNMLYPGRVLIWRLLPVLFTKSFPLHLKMAWRVTNSRQILHTFDSKTVSRSFFYVAWFVSCSQSNSEVWKNTPSISLTDHNFWMNAKIKYGAREWFWCQTIWQHPRQIWVQLVENSRT